MKYGMFMMPSHPPERDLIEAHEWDLDCLALADKLASTKPGLASTSPALGNPYRRLT